MTPLAQAYCITSSSPPEARKMTIINGNCLDRFDTRLLRPRIATRHSMREVIGAGEGLQLFLLYFKEGNYRSMAVRILIKIRTGDRH